MKDNDKNAIENSTNNREDRPFRGTYYLKKGFGPKNLRDHVASCFK